MKTRKYKKPLTARQLIKSPRLSKLKVSAKNVRLSPEGSDSLFNKDVKESDIEISKLTSTPILLPKIVPKRKLVKNQNSDESTVYKKRNQAVENLSLSTTCLFSRLEEKEELKDLNNRLADYINHVHGIVSQSSLDNSNIELHEHYKDDLSRLENVYSDELAVLRQTLDASALRLADAQITSKAALADREESIDRFNQLSIQHNRVVDELKNNSAKLAIAEADLKLFEDLKKRHSTLTRQHEVLRKQLEQETLLRTDIENRHTTLLEEFEFKQRLFDEERKHWLDEMTRLQTESASRISPSGQANDLQLRLDELRERFIQQTEETRKRLETLQVNQLNEAHLKAADLERQLVRQTEAAVELRRQAAHQTALQADMEARLTATMQKAEAVEAERRVERVQTEKQRDDLLRLVDKTARECARLAGIKLELDAELAMYRALLQAEETRCNITPPERQKREHQKEQLMQSWRKTNSAEKLLSKSTQLRRTKLDSSHEAGQTSGSTSSSQVASLTPCPPLPSVDLDASDSETGQSGKVNWRDNTARRLWLSGELGAASVKAALEADDDALCDEDHVNGTEALGRSTMAPRSALTEASIESGQIGMSNSIDTEQAGGLQITCRADGPVHFDEVDPGSQTLHIYNATDEPLLLENWKIYFGPLTPDSTDFEKLIEFRDDDVIGPHSDIELHISEECASTSPLADKTATAASSFSSLSSSSMSVSSSRQVKQQCTALRSDVCLQLAPGETIWRNYVCVIALQDPTGKVRAICELEPLEVVSKQQPTVSPSRRFVHFSSLIKKFEQSESEQIAKDDEDEDQAMADNKVTELAEDGNRVGERGIPADFGSVSLSARRQNFGRAEQLQWERLRDCHPKKEICSVRGCSIM